MQDEIVRTALAPGAECLSMEELGRYFDDALQGNEQTAAVLHLRNCLSCQAELALMRAVTAEDLRADEAEIVRDGVAHLERHSSEIFADSTKPAAQAGWFRPRIPPMAFVTAVVAIAIATSSLYFLLSRTAPRLPSRVTTGDEVTRSLAIVARGPIGDQAESPRRLEWRAVDRAVRYRVRLMEVDRHEVWATSTTAPGADLPPPVRASISPARTMLWDVVAYDAAGTAVAESGPQSFRLMPR